jgi:hypothetical protein
MLQVDVIIRFTGCPSKKKYKVFADKGISADKIHTNTTLDLKYCLRGIIHNMKWVNKIYLVIDDYELLPKWFKKNKKMIIIKHSQIIPEKFLPTLNSNIIDSFIFNIPNLTEEFIIADDDTYVLKKTTISDFFDKNNKPITRYKTLKYTKKSDVKGKESDCLFTTMWYRGVLKYGLKQINLQHQIQPLTKSVMIKYYNEIFSNQIKNNIFRKENNVNITRYSEALMSLNKENIKLKTTDELFMEGPSIDSMTKKNINKIVQDPPKFLCINNSFDSYTYVYDFLEQLLPYKSIFEK